MTAAIIHANGVPPSSGSTVFALANENIFELRRGAEIAAEETSSRLYLADETQDVIFKDGTFGPICGLNGARHRMHGIMNVHLAYDGKTFSPDDSKLRERIG